MPRMSELDKQFYSEEYAFNIDLDQKGARASVKLVFSNVLGPQGTAITSVSWKGPQGKSDKAKTKTGRSGWSLKKSPFELDMGKVKLAGDHEVFTLHAEGSHSVLDLTFRAVVPGFVPGTGRVELANQGFIETLVWPKLSIQGTIQDRKTQGMQPVTGWGVLLHATTTVPPQYQPNKWYMFRSFDRDKVALFQAVELPADFGGKVHGWIVMYDGNRKVIESNNLLVSPGNMKVYEQTSLPSYVFAKDEGRQLLIGINVVKFKKSVDQLKKLGAVEAAIVSKWIRPISFEFEGEIDIHITLNETVLFVNKVERFKLRGLYKLDRIR